MGETELDDPGGIVAMLGNRLVFCRFCDAQIVPARYGDLVVAVLADDAGRVKDVMAVCERCDETLSEVLAIRMEGSLLAVREQLERPRPQDYL